MPTAERTFDAGVVDGTNVGVKGLAVSVGRGDHGVRDLGIEDV